MGETKRSEPRFTKFGSVGSRPGSDGDDPEVNLDELDDEELAELAAAAARAGDVELIEAIARRLGGIEALASIFPEILEILAESGNELAAAILAAKGLLRRPSRSRDLGRARVLAWDILQAAAAAGQAALLAQIFAREAWLVELSKEAAVSGAGSLAALAPDPPTVKALLCAGAPLDAPDPSGTRPLEALLDAFEAFEPGSPQAETLALLCLGRDWTRAGSSADALERAVGKPEALEALLDSGASADCVLQDGSSPLAKAAELGCERSCEILLRRGADPTRVDRLGRLPEERAKTPGCRRMVAQARESREDLIAGVRAAEQGLGPEAPAEGARR